MAHNPISRQDIPEDDEPGFALRNQRPGEATVPLAQWVRALCSHAEGRLSPELVLDLVLNEAVQRACQATNANASAIALLRAGEMVCRAATGQSAPGLGVRLRDDSGLSAACVRSKQPQRCDDTECDSRVDSELCRLLGVQSILIVPVMSDENLLGIVEVLAPHPHAFGHSETRSLAALADEMVKAIDLAHQISAEPADPVLPVLPLESRQENAVTPLDGLPVGRERRSARLPQESDDAAGMREVDRWAGALLVAVVVLALTLGWMVGRAGVKKSSVMAAHSVPAAAPATAAPGPAPAVAPKTIVGAAATAADASSDLTIYRNGHVVYQGTGNAPTAVSGSVKSAANKSEVARPRPVRLAPQIAEEYLTDRIEPEYPSREKAARIHGPVTLDVIVGADGTVQSVNTIEGNSQLANAAMAAVRQWRYRPFLRNGEPEPFQTRITLPFSLTTEP